MRLPEPPIGPETGIVARLSDALRLTNGLTDRAADLLPRVSLCFVAEDRDAAQRLAVAYPHLYFLLQDGLCYHGHTLTGGKKTASGPLALKREAREVGLTLQTKQKQLEEEVAQPEELDREIALLEAELERLRSSQQAREKDRLALEHEMRKLAEDTNRANSRLSVARLELERCAWSGRNRSNSARRARARTNSAKRCARKRKSRSKTSGRNWRSWRPKAPRWRRSIRLCAPNWPAWRSGTAANGRRWHGWKRSTRETGERRRQIAPEIERLGVERAHLLADNIELDRKSAELAAQVTETEAEVNRLAIEETGMREALRAGEEELKQIRAQVIGSAGETRRRSKWIW